MSLTPLAFTGISQYSADFQTILTRVVTIASFPLTQLKNEQADNTTKKQLSSELSASVTTLQSRLKSLADVADKRGVSASSSNTSKLSIDAVNSDTPTSYSISNVTSIAKAASENSLSSFADPSSTAVSSTGSLKLTFGSTDYDITLGTGENTLLGLRDKINALGAGLTASILNVSATENYLSVSSNTAGAKALTLRDDPTGANTSLLSSSNQGSDLVFQLNGIPVTRSSNQVNDLIGGVTFSVKATTDVGETLSINLASDKSKLSTALFDFVDAYNAVQTKVNGQVGESAGLLSGDFLIREAQDALRRVSSFGLSSGSVKSLADVGVTFDSTGVLTFDSTAFNSLSSTAIQDAFSFFKTTTGLGTEAARLDSFTDSVTGLAQVQLNQYTTTDSRLSDQISILEERINAIQISYQQRLQAADALLGRIESQQTIITASIDSLNLLLYGKREG
jgi:flagellar hook-associated protein 2